MIMTISERRPMSLGQLVDHVLGRYLRAADESRSRVFMESLVEGGRKKAFIVTGEFDSSFYTHEIGDAVANSLRRGMDISILLTEKVPSDKDASIQKLVKDNYHFFDSIRSHVKKEDIGDLVLNNMHFFFSAVRQERHFAVVDQDVFLESYHLPHEPRSVYIRQNTRYLAGRYCSEWKDIIDKSTSVYPVDTTQIFKAFKNEKKEMLKKRETDGIF